MSTLTAPGQLELPLELFWQEAWLPTYPQATDDLALGVRRTSRDQALTRAYIEANPRDLHSLLVTDIDHYDAVIRALWDTKHFRPNIITENPQNGHAHAVWALRHPFPTTDYARRRPVYQAATITEGLRRYTDADAGYSGLITKNPLHEHWHTLYLHKHRFTFAELADGLRGVDSYPERGWRTSKRLARTDYAGLGRNCLIFETVRIWAYPEVHHHLGRPDSLAAAIHSKACEINHAEFKFPLPSSEVKTIANSITKWIIQNFDGWQRTPAEDAAWWSAKQAARGRKKGQLMEAKFATLWEEKQ